MKKIAAIWLMASTSTAFGQAGFIIRAGEGEELMNGIVLKLSPNNGTSGVALGEQTFPRGGTTGLHVHDHVSESFYVVSGRGLARLGDASEPIGPGDVLYVPPGGVHAIDDLDDDEPLVVLFFTPTPEIAEQMRAVHERLVSEPYRPITPEESAEFTRRYGGSRRLRE